MWRIEVLARRAGPTQIFATALSMPLLSYASAGLRRPLPLGHCLRQVDILQYIVDFFRPLVCLFTPRGRHRHGSIPFEPSVHLMHPPRQRPPSSQLAPVCRTGHNSKRPVYSVQRDVDFTGIEDEGARYRGTPFAAAYPGIFLRYLRSI